MIGHDKNRAVNPYNPFHGLWVSVTRKTARGDVLWPEERVTREEALRMYTIWAAWMQFAEKSRGSIEAGKLADLVVVDRDYLTCPRTRSRRSHRSLFCSTVSSPAASFDRSGRGYRSGSAHTLLCLVLACSCGKSPPKCEGLSARNDLTKPQSGI
jgi:hypothetical protein